MSEKAAYREDIRRRREWQTPSSSPPTHDQADRTREYKAARQNWVKETLAVKVKELESRVRELESTNERLHQEITVLKAGASVNSQNFPQPCRAEFASMAQTDPSRLGRWIQSLELSNAHLSFALEFLGQAEGQTDLALKLALEHLRHPSPLVREGAIYALELRPITKRMRAKLERIVDSDPSKGVREAAKEVLSE